MASSIVEEPPISANEANAPPATMDAKIMVATGRVDCQRLKDLLTKEDPATMVVVMASSHQTSKMKPRSSPIMNSRLLAAACSGSWEELELLVNGEDCQTSSNGASGSSTMQRAYDDEEAFLREPLLNGVTVGGNTALHVVASYGQGDTFSTIYNRAALIVENGKHDTPRCRAALHFLHSYGDGENFLKSAGIIYKKAENLLFVQNNNGDTPLHCAARAGKSQMVSFLIDLAKGEDNDIVRVKALLETENQLKNTALHEAVRIGNNDMVNLFMNEDPGLACFPKDGTSPLYLAVSLGNKIIAKALLRSGGSLSYAGPNGQNALHAAVLRGKELTEMLLERNTDITRLTAQIDENGSTPLHFAASLLDQGRRGSVCRQVVEADSDALYAPDKDGLFPIHVAASVGANTVISIFLKKSPSCAGLRDAKGRTFLHVAIEKGRAWTVFGACRDRSISWILNMQDNDGNTALHLAVQAGSLLMFCALLHNRQVHLNLINDKGETPRDISLNKIDPAQTYPQTSARKIRWALLVAGAIMGVSRRDHFEENYNRLVKRDEKGEMEKLQGSTQTLTIGSVLIASVTFGATFALPGGYRADDHTNGGAPTLGGRYAFRAFIMSNTLAFIFSMIATIGLMRSGSPMFDPWSRNIHLHIAFGSVQSSITSLTAALATAAYVVLAPVAHKTAVAICVLSTLVALYRLMELMVKHVLVILSLYTRKGIIWTTNSFVNFILFNVVTELGPVIFTFGWAAYARK